MFFVKYFEFSIVLCQNINLIKKKKNVFVKKIIVKLK